MLAGPRALFLGCRLWSRPTEHACNIIGRVVYVGDSTRAGVVALGQGIFTHNHYATHDEHTHAHHADGQQGAVSGTCREVGSVCRRHAEHAQRPFAQDARRAGCRRSRHLGSLPVPFEARMPVRKPRCLEGSAQSRLLLRGSDYDGRSVAMVGI